ncbi:PIG-L family deacetylase [Sungkyunkwania multivorans]|uniref:PIG-L family deacetylase n=1 Tax=Sungkyunkwania multivorans TaxID=1173618 RepID=A0ABW3CVM4_9FLAO
MHRIFLLLALGWCFVFNVQAQRPEKPSSTAIYEKIQKLNFLGSAMYVAAHPDDENTRLISYLSNHVKARTAYLSMTRGDGGQNLIGPELRELLGVIRTQELLAARRVDGGEQLFTRANDFGYSKHPDETLAIWNKDEVLSDVVWAIRKFKPDVIINRFDHRTPGRTHGHHTASAMLSMEAFDLVGDRSKYPSQLDHVDAWQPKRLFFNTSWWFYGSQENFEKADKSNMLSMDIGVYYPMKGLSNNELASIASSQHLCQGFGRLSTRGTQEEYVELLKGDLPKDKDNIFDGINTTWTRVKGGKAIQMILKKVEDNFNFANPSIHIEELVRAYQLIGKLEDEHWKAIKSKEIKEIIAACAGLYLEASAADSFVSEGGSIEVNIEALNRSNANIQLLEVNFRGCPENRLLFNQPLKDNQKFTTKKEVCVNPEWENTAPYWLQEKASLGMYAVRDKMLIGKPETPRALVADIKLKFQNVVIPFERPVVYRYSKPDKGELYKPFEILPEVTASIKEKVIIFANGPREIPVTIKAGGEDIDGNIQLAHPKGWRISPKSIDFKTDQKGEEKTVVFTVTPPKDQSEGLISPIVKVGDRTYTKELVEIDYDHIPFQSVLLPSEAKVVRLDIQKSGEHIGYIVGAGDSVPESLKQIGYHVTIIDPKEIDETSLDKFDAVVLGIRAYNTVDELKFKQKYLLEYVKNGGTMITQYNTSRRVDVMAPFELSLSRDRVTDENADVRILAKDHSLVNFPNTITEKDFDGWVQERGLYFPNEWGSEFTPILSTNDEGESPKNGSLLVAKYGEGHYIYTGLSFFRELPAGVPGAYKLFANMLSIGKDQVETTEKIKG